MTAAVATTGLGRRYRRKWALRDCTLAIEPGSITGLVGPNGAGKTTLLHLLAGMGHQTEGEVTIGGMAPTDRRALAAIGFVAQHAPVYPNLSVADHLRLGARLNPRWDAALAEDRISRLGLDAHQAAGKLSGGERAQLALTICLAKRPELILLDEPVASLDPLARREFLAALMETIADTGATAILSSHLVADVERVCDHVVVIAGGRVHLTGGIDELLAAHRRIVLPDDGRVLPSTCEVIQDRVRGRQRECLVRDWPTFAAADVSASDLSLEDLLLAYMRDDRTSERALDVVA